MTLHLRRALRPATIVLVVSVCSLMACGGDDGVAADTDRSTIPSAAGVPQDDGGQESEGTDATEPQDDGGQESEGNDPTEEQDGVDPDALDASSVCLGLHEAWATGDGHTAQSFATPDTIDSLFSLEFVPPANQAVGGAPPDCFYNTPDTMVEILLTGDGHVGFTAVGVTFYNSDEFFSTPELVARFEAGSG